MDEELRENMRPFNKSSTAFQSENPGKTIKSPRKFGIEAELIMPSADALHALDAVMPKDFGIEHDGSIRAENGGGIEIVSPIMAGAKGESIVRDLYSWFNQYKFKINASCGLHVHLDGGGFKNEQEVISTTVGRMEQAELNKINRSDRVMVVKRQLLDDIVKASSRYEDVDKEEAAQIILDEYSDGQNHNTLFLSKTFGFKVPDVRVRSVSVKIGSRAYTVNYFDSFSDFGISKEKEVEMDINSFGASNKDYLFVFKPNMALQNTKTLLYLYSVFNDVFMSMLPKSRREMNTYCQSLGLSFSATQIESIKSYAELEAAWYKTRDTMETAMRKGNHYDDSRYYGVNLHSLFAKYGTVEMRAHSATLEPNKVLYWVALHQEILDKIVRGEITIDYLRSGAHLFNLSKKTDYLLSALNLRTSLRKYMLQRIKHFSEDNK